MIKEEKLLKYSPYIRNPKIYVEPICNLYLKTNDDKLAVVVYSSVSKRFEIGTY